jgi:SAM-dependent methyltransferase
MKLNPQELNQIASRTLDQYNDGAEDFWEGTRGHDVSQNIAALLQYIEGDPPFTLLDFGCGPGRDLKTLADRGHLAIGLDGAARFTAMARVHSGCEVWQQDFLKLELPDGHFDGIFANGCAPLCCFLDGFDPGSIDRLCRWDGNAFGLVDRPLEVADALAQRAADITEFARPEDDQDDHQQKD